MPIPPPFGTELAYQLGMSNKYLVLADVDGEIKFLSLRSNGSKEEVAELSLQMTEKLFSGHRVGELWLEPWPLDESMYQPAPRAVEQLVSRQAV